MYKAKRISKRINISLIIVSIILLILVMFFSQADLAYAQTASYKLGSVNYEGSRYYCRYDLMIQATGIEDGVITDTRDFKIYLEGKSCKRNIFTTFTYDLKFTLYKDGVYNNEVSIYFKIDDKDDVPGSIKVIFSGPFDNGDYKLKVKGIIDSNDVENINGEYYFTIDK